MFCISIEFVLLLLICINIEILVLNTAPETLILNMIVFVRYKILLLKFVIMKTWYPRTEPEPEPNRNRNRTGTDK